MRNFFLYFAAFLVVLMLQEFLLAGINVFSLLNIYLYIIIIVMLPMDMPPVGVLFSALAVGAVMDVFTGTSALITMCLLAVGFMRRAIMNLTIGRDMIIGGGTPFSRRIGAGAFLRYCFVMCFIYGLFYFMLEMMTMQGLLFTLLRIVVSSVATTLLVYVLQLPLRVKNG